MKLYHPSATSCSWQGETFEAGQDGAIEVPDQAAADLVAHGFTTAPEAAKPTGIAPPSGNPAKWKGDVLQAEAKRLGVDPALPRAELLKAVAGARKAEAEAAENELVHQDPEESPAAAAEPEPEPEAAPEHEEGQE